MEILGNYPNIKKSIEFSKGKIEKLEREIQRINMRGANLVAYGSYARQEASELSDFDYVLVCPAKASETDMAAVSEEIRKLIQHEIGRLPSTDGAFGAPIRCGDLTKDIGGDGDTNHKITLRLLFLTESKPIGAREHYEDQKQQLISRYIQESIPDYQLALFYLNDVIRYWRTMCIDFEFKTFEKGKEWGDRNIKLVFSRRLLYFAGLLIAAETAHRTVKEKREIFERLMFLSPLERLVTVCGSSSARVLSEYDYFLEQMKNPKVRSTLKKLDRDTASSNEEFRRLKNRSHHLADNLISLLQTTYSSSHPIHRSVVM
jgi:predicted nucleotidyltransferase